MRMCRRLTVLLMAAIMGVIILTGCSGEVNNQIPAADESVAAALSVEEMYSAVSELGVLPEMLMLDDAYISGYYGIDESHISEKVFAVADDALKADTVIIVKAVDDTKAEEMASIFKSINNQRMMELESYNPEQYARVENALIKNSGSYVYYLVTDANNAVAQLIESSIG